MIRYSHSTVLTDPPGHSWRDKWTALSGPLSQDVSALSRRLVARYAADLSSLPPSPLFSPRMKGQYMPSPRPWKMIKWTALRGAYAAVHRRALRWV